MAVFAELIPIAVFFIAFKFSDIYVATLITMAVATSQILISIIKKELIPVERWVNIAIWLIFGTITLTFRSSEVIKLKPTIGYIVSATTFFLAPYRTNLTPLENALTPIFNISHVSSRTWNYLNIAWVCFLCSLGILNLIVAYNTDTNTWVYFKLFGPLLVTLFALSQFLYVFLFKKITFKS